MKKLLLIACLFCSTFLLAQEATLTQEDINAQNQASDASTKDITPKSLEDFFSEFKEQFGIEYGETKEGKTFYTGSANVLVNETDPQFAKALQNGYQRALLNLQRDFIKDAFGRISTEKIANYEADNSSNNREFEELPKGGTIQQVLDKLTQLAGAKIDNALKDLGVSPAGLNEERKKTLLKDEFITKNMVNAFGSMSGLVPVQTVVTHKRGEYQVGVIAVISNKTRQIARDMSLERESLIRGKGKKITEYLPKENAGFLNEYGIRLVYDETGAPVILSYGNWGFVANSSNNRMTNRLEEQAKNTASSQADAAIIEFIKVNISLADVQTTGENYEEIIKQSTELNNNSIQEQDQTIVTIIDKVSSKVRATASGKIRGIRTLKTWSETSENGVEHVGVVRAYSYANLRNTKEALEAKTQTDAQKNTQSSAKTQRQSNIVNSVDDF